MSDRRLAITGSIPLPESLVLAGKMQSFVGGLIDELQTKLKENDIDAEIDVRVVSNRPKAPKTANGAGTVVQAAAPAATEAHPGAIGTGVGSAQPAQPSWAKPA